jgi:hypothetical protein
VTGGKFLPIAKDRPQALGYGAKILESVRQKIADSKLEPLPSLKNYVEASKDEEIIDLVNEFDVLIPKTETTNLAKMDPEQPASNVHANPTLETKSSPFNLSGTTAASSRLEEAALILDERMKAIKAEMLSAEDAIVAAQLAPALRQPLQTVKIPGGNITVFKDGTIELNDKGSTRFFRNFDEFERYWREWRV